MSIHDPITLRKRLRHETGPAHEALDRKMRAFDVATRGGLTAFVAIHEASFSALRDAAPGASCAAVLEDLVARLRSDRETIAGELPTVRQDRPLDPRAVDYIVLGSRLGTRVLRKRWQSTMDPEVAKASAYFSAPDHPDAWRAHCQMMSDRPATGSGADDVVASALKGFAIFDSAISSYGPAEVTA